MVLEKSLKAWIPGILFASLHPAKIEEQHCSNNPLTAPILQVCKATVKAFTTDGTSSAGKISGYFFRIPFRICNQGWLSCWSWRSEEPAFLTLSTKDSKLISTRLRFGAGPAGACNFMRNSELSAPSEHKSIWRFMKIPAWHQGAQFG